MTRPWPPFAAREAVLLDLERAIRANPVALDTKFYYASFLRDHGRLDDALDVFAGIVAAAPDHVETLVAYGVALAKAGRRFDARVPLERAARDARHPAALVNLANVLAIDDPARAEALARAALALDPAHVFAHRTLCSLAAARGDRAAADRHRALGYAPGSRSLRPYYGATAPAVVLALVSTDGGNIPLDALLDPHRFAVHEIFVEAGDHFGYRAPAERIAAGP